MPDMIRGGTGAGYMAGVTNEHQLLIRGVTESAERYENEEGRAYHLLFDVTPTGAGDCFLYLKNASDKDIVVEGFTYSVASAEKILIKVRDTGTPAGGATATPVNCNAGKISDADGTFQTGNDITGLSGGLTVDKLWCTSTETVNYNFEQDIFVPKNMVFTMYAVTGAINVRGTLIFNFYNETY